MNDDIKAVIADLNKERLHRIHALEIEAKRLKKLLRESKIMSWFLMACFFLLAASKYEDMTWILTHLQ